MFVVTPGKPSPFQCNVALFPDGICGPCGGKGHRTFGLHQSTSTFSRCPLWVKSRHRVISASCPLYPPKADMGWYRSNVRFVPIADSCAATKRKTALRRSLRKLIRCQFHLRCEEPDCAHLALQLAMQLFPFPLHMSAHSCAHLFEV